ncbi:MAG: condensation domain-containing protein [Streptosporangiaceae bacterium]
MDRISRLKTLAAGHDATVYTALLTAFAVLLHRYSGQADIIVGSPFAARSRAALAGVVGYLMNTVPLRVNLAGDPSFAELLGRVRTVVTQGLAHQDFPFAEMVARRAPWSRAYRMAAATSRHSSCPRWQ